jgi:hypothetical protein
MDRDTILREYHQELGAARWEGTTAEQRVAATEPMRRGRRTNEERFRALMAEVQELRAEVSDLRQRVAA